MKTATVSARVTRDVDDKLTRLAESTHRSKSYLAAQAIKAFVSDQHWQIEAIMDGIKEAVLLDEPTNYLDVETLQSLEAALEDFAGCAVVISHDRWFLNRLATHILAFEGDSHVEWFEGDFDSYEEDKMRRLGVTEIIPTRIKFQKFGR